MPCSRCCGYDQKTASRDRARFARWPPVPGGRAQKAGEARRPPPGRRSRGAGPGPGQGLPPSGQRRSVEAPEPEFPGFPRGQQGQAGIAFPVLRADRQPFGCDQSGHHSESAQGGFSLPEKRRGIGRRARAVTACWPAGAADRPRRKERPPAGRDNPGCFAPGPCCRAPKRPRTRPHRPGRG